jgi:hypothetical protein
MSLQSRIARLEATAALDGEHHADDGFQQLERELAGLSPVQAALAIRKRVNERQPTSTPAERLARWEAREAELEHLRALPADALLRRYRDALRRTP